MSAPKSFFLADGPSFIATELTRGPWSNQHQHGGPPGALLGRGLERFGDDAADWFVARLTIELLRPVPIDRLELEVTAVKLGGRVQRLQARLHCKGTEVMIARGLRLRRVESGAGVRAGPSLSPPDSAAPYRLTFFQHEVGYHTAMELRFVRGQWGENPVGVWMRSLVPLVDDQPTSPLERVITVADAESGVCPVLDPRQFTFLNPDLTVVLDRPLSGEWVGMEASASTGPEGVGIAQAALHDVHGPIGRSIQTLLIERRSRP